MLLIQHVLIHEHRFIQLGAHIKQLHIQLHASGFQTGEIQQLLHHLGQTAAFLLDNAQSHDNLIPVGCAAGKQRITPAADCRQRGTQFMGYRGNKVIFHALGTADFLRHMVNCITQVTDFIVIDLMQPHAIPSGSNFLGNDIDFHYRFHNGFDKIPVGQLQ